MLIAMLLPVRPAVGMAVQSFLETDDWPVPFLKLGPQFRVLWPSLRWEGDSARRTFQVRLYVRGRRISNLGGVAGAATIGIA